MRSGGGDGGEGASLEGALPEESVIVISDDEGEVSLGLGNSVLLIEEAEESVTPAKRKLEVLDDELAITFSKRAQVMPHARYDCPSHAFVRAEQETEIPLEQNASFCEQCYCYLCDKTVSQCSSWTSSSGCHCNAHNKSKYWKELRDAALVGILTLFNLDLGEIDAELREGGRLLQQFASEMSQAQQQYLQGKILVHHRMVRSTSSCRRTNNSVPRCKANVLHQTRTRVYSYTAVYQLVTEYLDKADGEHPKTAAVMLLGAARELVLQKILVSLFPLPEYTANVKEATNQLMLRITSTLQRHLVLADYPKNLHDKFVTFFQSLPLPPYCCIFKNSLNVRRWDNYFLSSVLSGQNPTGIRTHKGKRESLWEQLPVVQSRVRRLEENNSYRQLVRYLNAVMCADRNGLFELKQKLAFYMCKFGDFSGAATFLLQTNGVKTCLAQTLTPQQFEFYLLMLRTRSCPPGNEPVPQELWVPSEGPPLKKGLLLRTAIRILFSNNALLCDPRCWISLIRVWCTGDTLSENGKLLPLTVAEPNKQFQSMVMEMSCGILNELQMHFNVQLPEPFHKAQWVSAELILIVATVFRFMASGTPLSNMLELVFAFGFNLWALELLMADMNLVHFMRCSFVGSVRTELQQREPHAMDLLNSRGPDYVSRLISVFLLHRSETVRITGLQFINVLLKNVERYPWTPIVGNNLKNRVMTLTFCSEEERRQLLHAIDRLISRA